MRLHTATKDGAGWHLPYRSPHVHPSLLLSGFTCYREEAHENVPPSLVPWIIIAPKSQGGGGSAGASHPSSALREQSLPSPGLSKGHHHKGPRQAGNKSLLSFVRLFPPTNPVEAKNLPSRHSPKQFAQPRFAPPAALQCLTDNGAHAEGGPWHHGVRGVHPLHREHSHSPQGGAFPPGRGSGGQAQGCP